MIKHSLHYIIATIIALCFLLFLVQAIAYGESFLSASGRFEVRDTERLDESSARQHPDLEGRIKLDGAASGWRVFSWIEGGWDGTADTPARDGSLLKDFDRVYQSNSPYAEVKEFYVSRSTGELDLRAGIQRYSWGRLDEYPLNDLLNPWDYTRFLVKSLEDRKIGVPSLSATVNGDVWSTDIAWVPVFVPYRLPLPDERWSGISQASSLLQAVPGTVITPSEPALPDRTMENGSAGLRIRHTGDIEWSLNLFHGIDPRPVFKTTALTIVLQGSSLLVDPGYVPDFHRIDVIGMDATTVRGDFSVRAEAAYSHGRYLNIRRELWGYPPVPYPGAYPLAEIGQQHDTLEYGMNADYRLFEDATITFQAQQTVTLGDVDLLYERRIETVLWANLKVFLMNQNIETNVNAAWNPEHGDGMAKANVWYVFSDYWKAGVSAILPDGPSQSLFGRYNRNDQVEAEIVYAW